MRELLRQRHAANERLAPARVLNLIVIVDREWKGEIANRLERAGRYHGSRTILCTVTEGRTTLDATATRLLRQPRGQARRDVGEDRDRSRPRAPAGAADDHRPDRRVGVADRAVVAASPRRRDPGAAAADRRDPARLRRLPVRRRRVRAGVLGPRPRVRDRSRLAAHDPVARAAGGELRPAVAAGRRCAMSTSSNIRHRDGSSASALLLAGWLASRLGWEPVPLELHDARPPRGQRSPTATAR